ncbi:histone-lysine N-methyltransferase 2D-like [Zophobas morio]|uniref:histone-lysine N-methyltransferase 2D-like n=1 Tax=Zophobas morio TaxID=2755281 RepID=UPI0030829725
MLLRKGALFAPFDFVLCCIVATVLFADDLYARDHFSPDFGYLLRRSFGGHMDSFGHPHTDTIGISPPFIKTNNTPTLRHYDSAANLPQRYIVRINPSQYSNRPMMRSLFSPSKTEASKMNNGLSEPRSAHKVYGTRKEKRPLTYKPLNPQGFLKRQFNRPKYLQRNEIVPQIGYAPTWQLANAEWPSFHQQPDFFQSQSQPHATEYSWPKRPSPVFDPAADFSHLQMLPQTEDYSPPQRRPPSDTHFALPSEDSSIATERWPSFGQELGFYPEFSEFSELPEEIDLPTEEWLTLSEKPRLPVQLPPSEVFVELPVMDAYDPDVSPVFLPSPNLGPSSHVSNQPAFHQVTGVPQSIVLINGVYMFPQAGKRPFNKSPITNGDSIEAGKRSFNKSPIINGDSIEESNVLGTPEHIEVQSLFPPTPPSESEAHTGAEFITMTPSPSEAEVYPTPRLTEVTPSPSGLEESVTPGFISVTPSSAEPEESVTHEFISVTPSSAGVEVPDTPQFIEVKSPPSELGVSFEPELTKVTPPPTESQPQWFQTMTQYFSPTAATEPPELPVTTKILLPPATEAPQFSHITETFLPPPSAPEVFQGPEIIEQYSPPPAPEVFQGPEIIEQYSSPPGTISQTYKKL